MRFLAASASAVLLVLAGCSKDSSDDDPPSLAVSIGTTPSPANILVGGSVSFTGSVTSGTAPYTYLWTFPGGTPGSSTAQNPGSVAFSAPGDNVNTVTFQVTDKDGLVGSASVPVSVYRVLSSISLTPATANLKQAATLDFTVTANFADATNQVVTSAASYASGDTTRIRMTNNRALALVGPTLTNVTITSNYTHGVAGNSASDTSTITTLDPDVRWTKAQIQTRWDALKAVETAVSYQDPPDMTVNGFPGDEGQLKPQMITDGANRTNMYRYLAGLPDSLTVTSTQTVNCQKGAHVLAMLELEGLTNYNPHTPPRPSGVGIGSLYDINIYLPGEQACGESNIMRGYFTGTDTGNVPTLPECVDGWMDDFGNADTLGHRRWILLPELASTTFGMVWASHGAPAHTHYACLMRVWDWTAPTPAYSFVAYPSEGFYPKQLFDDPNDGERVLWSFSVNDATYGFDAQTSVTVVRQSDGAAIPVTTSILLAGYGITPTISFNPNESTLGETYYVTVSNINVLAGGHTTYSYWVSFYNLTP